MARNTGSAPHFGILMLLLISVAIIFAAILPIGPGYATLPGPDFLLLTFLMCSIRRPELVPVWIIALVFFLADLLLMRAPGLMAAIVVLATEYVKTRKDMTVEVPFVVEWSFATAIILAITVLSSMVLGLLGSFVPSLGPLLIKLIATVLAYPLVVIIGRYVFGIDRPTGKDDLGFRGGS